MKLFLFGPDIKKNYEILWLEVEATVGNFVIQDGHAPLLLILKPDQEIIFSLHNGIIEKYLIPGGILEITRSDATLLLNE
jgi:F0F1-type ATP synthase epsilon subunit